MSTKIDRLSELAKEDPKRRFFSIGHLITPEAMYKDASAGVDGVTYEQYEKDAERNIRQLHERLRGGTYQAQPLRRVYIPKENGKQRPISIVAHHSRIRSCKRQWWRCWTPSTSRIFSIAPTGSDPDGEPTKRWTKWDE